MKKDPPPPKDSQIFGATIQNSVARNLSAPVYFSLFYFFLAFDCSVCQLSFKLTIKHYAKQQHTLCSVFRLVEGKAS